MVRLLPPIKNNVRNNPRKPNLWWNFNAHQPLSGLNVSNFMFPFIPKSSLVEIDHFSLCRDRCTRASIAVAEDDLPPCGFHCTEKLTSALIRHLYFTSVHFCAHPLLPDSNEPCAPRRSCLLICFVKCQTWPFPWLSPISWQRIKVSAPRDKALNSALSASSRFLLYCMKYSLLSITSWAVSKTILKLLFIGTVDEAKKIK